MLHRISFFLLLGIFLREIQAGTDPSYTVFAPSKIRRGEPYRVLVVIHKSPSPVQVNAVLTDYRNRSLIRGIASEEIHNQAAKLLNIVVGHDWEDKSQYELTVSGSGGIIFEKVFTVSFRKKSYSVFIQTDKPVYKPGGKVNFRVIAVDPLWKPYTQEPLDIFIEDAKSNRIKHWKDQNITSGLFVGEFPLSDEPVIGKWTIRVTYSKVETKTKNFEVQTYVLPRFDVQVQMPTYLTKQDREVTVSVTSKYTHGKSVKGEILLRISPKGNSECLPESFHLKLPIDGKLSKSISFREDLRLIDTNCLSSIDVEATVTEELTGIKKKGEGSVNVHPTDHNLRIITPTSNFIPGQPYTFWVSLLKQDGTPVTDNSSVIAVKCSGYNKLYENDFQLDPTGIVTVDIDMPNQIEKLSLSAKYNDVTTTATITPVESNSPSGRFMYVAVPGKKYKVGDQLDVMVKSSHTLDDKVIIQVLAHGEIVYADYVDGSRQESLIIPLKLTYVMVPRICILIFTNLEGELTADKVDVPVERLFKTNLEIETSINRTEPGNNITITVSTEPDALVALLAIGQGVMPIKSGNDITETEVNEDISTYYNTDTSHQSHRNELPENFLPKFLANPNRSPYPEEIFKEAGIEFATDGFILKPPPPIPPPIEVVYFPPPFVFLDKNCEMGQWKIGGIMERHNRRRSRINLIDIMERHNPSRSRDTLTDIMERHNPSRSRDTLTDILERHNPNRRRDTLFDFPRKRRCSGILDHLSSSPPVDILEWHNRRRRRDTLIAPDKGMSSLLSNIEKPQSVFTRVRTYFPETWLWNVSKAQKDGKVIFAENVPDTITSWVINAFAIHPETGLGFSAMPAKVTVSKSFFATLNLPYSIIRGETASIPVTVFNYLPQDQQVVVIIENHHDEFDFVSFDNNGAVSQKKRMSKHIEIKSGDGKTVNFLITPKVIGEIDIQVRAISQFAGDELIRQLSVKSEGIPRYYSNSILVDLRLKSKAFSTTIDFDIPSVAVPQSERIEVSVTGDVLGTVINNLDKLLHIPSGCGEQNLVKFVPDVVITKYLTATYQITPMILKKAVQFMETGYQRQLTYKHESGSYSAFGSRDETGSTWLTAFVVRSFYEAQPFITIDKIVLDQSIHWLTGQQSRDGSFPEIGRILDKRLQGGARKNTVLTAYVVTSLLMSEIGEDHPKYGTKVSNALSYLESNLANFESDYELAILTHTFHLTNKTELKDKLFSLLINAGTAKDGQFFWTNERNNDNKNESSSSEGTAASVEATAYALMSYILRNQIHEAIPIVRWLVNQQNQFGGFKSTQDTVLGIQALAMFAEKTTMPSGANVQVNVTDQAGSQTSFDLNPDNSLVLQKEVLNRKTRSVRMDATGNGVAIVQVTWSYNVNATERSKAFSLQPTVHLENPNNLHLNICTSYHSGVSSNMALMEITFPTGFYADDPKLPQISNLTKVKRVETKYRNSILAVYFDYVSAEEVCISANAVRTSKVAKLKPAVISIYDYYDPVKRAEVLFEVPSQDTSSLCELCDELDEDCLLKCNLVK